MHIKGQIKHYEDPWKKVALLSLQQLTEDTSINAKRVRALEMSVMTLTDSLSRSSSVGQQDLRDVTATLDGLHEEIGAWSKRSLDRAEELVVAVRMLLYNQELEPDMLSRAETELLAS